MSDIQTVNVVLYFQSRIVLLSVFGSVFSASLLQLPIILLVYWLRCVVIAAQHIDKIDFTWRQQSSMLCRCPVLAMAEMSACPPLCNYQNDVS